MLPETVIINGQQLSRCKQDSVKLRIWVILPETMIINGVHLGIITVSGKITEMRHLSESCLQRDNCWPLIITVSGKITQMRNLTESYYAAW